MSIPEYPSEVYEDHDDVTPEGVAFMKERSKSKIEGRKWKHIDGFNYNSTGEENGERN